MHLTVLAGETTDIAGIEQLSLCARYVEQYCIHDTFLQFAPIYDVTGKGIATTIVDQSRSFGVDISKMRGQGYDGAASMSGKFNGVQLI